MNDTPSLIAIIVILLAIAAGLIFWLIALAKRQKAKQDLPDPDTDAIAVPGPLPPIMVSGRPMGTTRWKDSPAAQHEDDDDSGSVIGTVMAAEAISSLLDDTPSSDSGSSDSGYSDDGSGTFDSGSGDSGGGGASGSW